MRMGMDDIELNLLAMLALEPLANNILHHCSRRKISRARIHQQRTLFAKKQIQKRFFVI